MRYLIIILSILLFSFSSWGKSNSWKVEKSRDELLNIDSTMIYTTSYVSCEEFKTTIKLAFVCEKILNIEQRNITMMIRVGLPIIDVDHIDDPTGSKMIKTIFKLDNLQIRYQYLYVDKSYKFMWETGDFVDYLISSNPKRIIMRFNLEDEKITSFFKTEELQEMIKKHCW